MLRSARWRPTIAGRPTKARSVFSLADWTPPAPPCRRSPRSGGEPSARPSAVILSATRRSRTRYAAGPAESANVDIDAALRRTRETAGPRRPRASRHRLRRPGRPLDRHRRRVQRRPTAVSGFSATASSTAIPPSRKSGASSKASGRPYLRRCRRELGRRRRRFHDGSKVTAACWARRWWAAVKGVPGNAIPIARPRPGPTGLHAMGAWDASAQWSAAVAGGRVHLPDTLTRRELAELCAGNVLRVDQGALRWCEVPGRQDHYFDAAKLCIWARRWRTKTGQRRPAAAFTI